MCQATTIHAANFFLDRILNCIASTGESFFLNHLVEL